MKIFLPHALLLVLALSCGLSNSVTAQNRDVQVSAKVKTIEVRKIDIAKKIEVYGEIIPDPDFMLSVSMPNAGLINRVWIKPGQRVQHGDKLFEIITAPDARMQYVQALGAVEYARKELTRKRQLLAEQLATKSEVDSAEKLLKDSQSTVDAMQSKGLQKAQDTIFAPVEGIITEISLTQGQRVSADTTALLIANQHHLIARLGVEPESLAKLSKGMRVTLKSVFIPNREIKTSIRELHAMINPATNLVDIYADIPAKSAELFVLGSRVMGNIYFPSHVGVIVPRNSVLEDEKVPYLYRIIHGKAKRVNVTVVSEEGTQIEVAGELKEGDIIVSTGNYELEDGMNVRVEP